MVFREVSVVEIRQVLRAWLDGAGLRTVGERAGVITDDLVGAVVAAVRPVRPNGHGPAWEVLVGGASENGEILR